MPRTFLHPGHTRMERWSWPPIWSHKISKPNSKKSRLWIFFTCRICQFSVEKICRTAKLITWEREIERETERQSWFRAARDPASVFRSEEVVGWRKGHIWRSWVAQPDFRLSHFVLPRPAGKKIYHPFLDSPIWNTKKSVLWTHLEKIMILHPHTIPKNSACEPTLNNHHGIPTFLCHAWFGFFSPPSNCTPSSTTRKEIEYRFLHSHLLGCLRNSKMVSFKVPVASWKF
jgi:hypothetical protein